MFLMKIQNIASYIQPFRVVPSSRTILGLNGVAIYAGISLRERTPTVTKGLLLAAMISHLWSLRQPIQVALMSGEQLASKASMGHDLATFAIRISNKTGYSPTTVAKVTAVLWTSSVPLLGMYTLFDQLFHPMYCVTDEKEVEQLESEGICGPYTPQQRHQARKTLYHQWHRQRRSPQLYKVATILTWGRMAVILSAKWSDSLALAAPWLAPYTQNLKLLVPFSGPLAVIGKGIRCYADFQADDRVVTQKAKWISVVDLLITTGVSVGILRGFYGNHSKVFNTSLIFAVTKARLIRHFRQREERIAFQAHLAR